MNKNELAAAVAEKTGLGKGDAASAVDAVFDTITSTLKSGGDIRHVALPGLKVDPPSTSRIACRCTSLVIVSSL